MTEKDYQSQEANTSPKQDNANGIHFLMGLMLAGVIGTGVTYSVSETVFKFAPEKARLEYINNDSLPDLVYKEGIYLQKKDGSFVSYKDVLKQQESKMDSIYQAKRDSLKKVYESKLEKEVQ